MSAEGLSRFFTENLTEEGRSDLNQWEAKTLEFAQRVNRDGCEGVAFITSGGTAVPLEVHAVRFVTNFSSGGRGAVLVEELLARGWACILLRSKTSQLPFRRLVDNMTTEQFFAELNAPQKSCDVSAAIEAYTKYKSRFLEIPYYTVVEYLYLFSLLTGTLSHRAECLRQTPMMLLAAAAVSDYYIPESRLSHHKMSGGDGLTIQFNNVPKILDLISEEWHGSSRAAPRYLITFKLETEEEQLKAKALRNLGLYRCDAVVANMLQNYRERVLVFWNGEEQNPTLLHRSPNGSVESLMIDHVLQRIKNHAKGCGMQYKLEGRRR
ncbi:DNA / pantothenate metabolism flavoprotein, putative [Trypanosoma equiperdum]|uniref:DNA/pantothenate metabolism flavoprotein C-terminal domain-containing protein n=2 Tax=Trypanozoon TaxID=39700 RepID=Q57ZB4_TRYB2|nr:hypothetical protein, conserved [Trypanosoma brucei brucei TREU927]AAX80224.1 hypothetical protein, conserved [Trypanosoma brucei]AAZ10232.1 hypothetical protein, conserved [Trypanosoma brucei brucei TREU927]SCU70675.1 DNA / pantothenate metabolism flavoprotein, putative [Trypanosoma equiperdum]